MRITYCLFLFLVWGIAQASEPVFKNSNLPEHQAFEITDYLNASTGYVVTKISISTTQEEGRKYYLIHANEGDLYTNDIKLDFLTLTTVSETRTNLKSNDIVESYSNSGNGNIQFFHRGKAIDRIFHNSDKNIYSRYAYFFSFRGFPFGVGNSVKFSSYMFEYGDALTMKVTNVSQQKVIVKAGIFECYKLELSVSGWQSAFAGDKYYLYYTIEMPHNFIKYEARDGQGNWNSNELIRFN